MKERPILFQRADGARNAGWQQDTNAARGHVNISASRRACPPRIPWPGRFALPMASSCPDGSRATGSGNAVRLNPPTANNMTDDNPADRARWSGYDAEPVSAAGR